MTEKECEKAMLKAHEENRKIWSSMTKEQRRIFVNCGLYFMV